MYAYKTDCSISQTSFHSGAKEGKGTHRKTLSGIRTTDPRSEYQQPTRYPTMFLVYIDRDWYQGIRTKRRLIKNEVKTKTGPAYWETTLARPRPPPAESGETSKVRLVEETPNRMLDPISH